MFITDNVDPGFRFESLARIAFDNCLKSRDPWGYASQDVYNNFVSSFNLKGKRILATILTKLIYDFKDKSICNKLIIIEDSIWSASTQRDVVNIIESTIKVLESID